MGVFQKIINSILIVATLQFFAPLVNASFSERCCESQQMQCCQGEFPGRAVCCIEKSDLPLDDSAPVKGVNIKIPNILQGNLTCLQSWTLNFSLPLFENLEPHSFLKYNSVDNQLYKRLSVYLI